MRSVVFRVLAGLLAVAFVALLAFGDTSKISLLRKFGIGIISVGFGLYALLGSDLGERFLWIAFGGRAPDTTESSSNEHAEPDDSLDRRNM